MCDHPAETQCPICKKFFSCRDCNSSPLVSEHLTLCTVDGQKTKSPQSPTESPPWKRVLRKKQRKSVASIPDQQGSYHESEEELEFSQYAQNPEDDFETSGKEESQSELEEKLADQIRLQSQEPLNRVALLSLITVDPLIYDDTETLETYALQSNQQFRLDMLRTLRLSVFDWISLWGVREYAPIFFLLQKTISSIGVCVSRNSTRDAEIFFMSGSLIPYEPRQLKFLEIIAISYHSVDNVLGSHSRKAWKILKKLLTEDSQKLAIPLFNFLHGMAAVKNGNDELDFMTELGVKRDICEIVSRLLLDNADACIKLKKHTPAISYIARDPGVGWVENVFTTETPAIKWG